MKNRRAVILLLVFFTVIPCMFAIAQNGQAHENEAPAMNQLLDFSRPGPNHEILNRLCGEWNFQDAKLSFVKGTLTRKPIYDGRFFEVQIVGGKLQLPVANGQMKEDNYQSRQLEGYDNPRQAFVMVSVNNHIGSDIQMQTGQFDAAKNEFTFEWEDMLVPQHTTSNKQVLKIVDNNHYTEEYFEVQEGKMVKVRQLNYERVH